MQTKIKELIEPSRLVKMKKGFRYLLFLDQNKITVEDLTEIKDYLEQYNIQLFTMMVDGDPNTAAKIYETETKI